MILNPLVLAARHGRLVLILGLVAGFALPGLAARMARHIPEMVAVIMFLGALRLSPQDVARMLTGLRGVLGRVLVLQLALPVALALLALAGGVAHSPWALALILLASAPPIVGSPNIAAILGLPAAPAMQYLVVGSLILPLSVLPVFWLLPALGAFDQILVAALRLLALIALAGGGAILLRAWALPAPSARTLTWLDGASVIGLSVFVIGLMPALAGAITTQPGAFAFWLVIAVAANFGTQIAVHLTMCGRIGHDMAGPLAFVAGNRNVSLFFAALPGDVTAPLLIFLGCYQLPMFLTPVLMGRLYRRAGSAA